MSDYHLLFSTDENYAPYMFVAFQSILDSLEDSSNNAQDHISFHVLVDDKVSNRSFQTCTKAFQELNTSAKVSFSIESHLINNEVFLSCTPMTKDGFTSFSTYYRILFAQVIPESITRILYMDIDVLVCDDMRKIFQQYPMGDEVLYACPNAHCFKYAKNPFATHPYYEYEPLNADTEPYHLPIEHFIEGGVQLINVEQWRKQKIEQKCLEIANNWKLDFHDQSAISIACQNQIKPLDVTCNFLFTYFRYIDIGGTIIGQEIYPFEKMPIKPAPTLEDLARLSKEPKIVHFVYFKPWFMTRALNPDEFEDLKSIFPYLIRWIKTFNRIKRIFKA